MSERRDQAIELFAPLGPTYDRVGALLSFGQDPRWRRALVSRAPADGGTCSTSPRAPASSPSALLARGHRVTGLDQSPDMLARRARAGSATASSSSRRPPTELPFADALVRPPHVHLPAALRRRSGRDARRARARRAPGRHDREARVLRSRAASGDRSGTSTSASACRWPAGSLSPGWYDVGRFLGPSIRGFYERWPLERQLELWREAGIADVRARRMSLGGGVVIWAARIAATAVADAARRVLRAATGGLARLRHAAAPAVHRLAPLLRRRRRLPRGRRSSW